jgi:purine-binding chemotaxis protein CheW
MRDAALDEGEEIRDESDALSMCSFYAGGEMFGIDTKKICEVLGERELQPVPLAPSFIAGVVSYRGEVLTTVDLRALLETGEREGRSNVLVLEDEQTVERFGLLVDAVGGVVAVSRAMLEANPSTLEARGRWLFDGAYKMREGLMVQLAPQRLCPSRLAETGLFRQRFKGGLDASTDCR